MIRLVADRTGSLIGISEKVSEPWWDNFIHHIIDHDESWTHYTVSEHRTMMRKKLKEHGADLIETHFGTVLDFDNDTDATAFVLRWS